MLIFLAFDVAAAPFIQFPGPLSSIAERPPAPARSPTPAPAKRVSTPPVAPASQQPPPARPAPSQPPKREPPTASNKRSRGNQAVVRAARHFLSHNPRGFRDDCSGFVMAVYNRAGLPISGNTRSLWADAKSRHQTHRRSHPLPGDLVFWDNTYDRNHNGRRDDPLTHVGIVLEVDTDLTITIAHGGTSRGRTTLKMNLRHPSDRSAPGGEVWNDWLRARRSGESKGAAYLAGELFRGFATIPE